MRLGQQSSLAKDRAGPRSSADDQEIALGVLVCLDSQVARRNGIATGHRLDSIQAQCNQCRALQPARACHFAHLAGGVRTRCRHDTVVHHQGLSEGGRETVSSLAAFTPQGSHQANRNRGPCLRPSVSDKTEQKCEPCRKQGRQFSFHSCRCVLCDLVPLARPEKQGSRSARPSIPRHSH